MSLPPSPKVSIGLLHAFIALFALAWVPAAPAATGAPQQQAAVDALQKAHAAVVGVQVHATGAATTAQTLGRQRSGSGVVISADGLILTIGYLLLEAETIQVVTQDQRTLPARAVAYDLATGFGLLRTLLPTRIAPVPLGSIADVAAGEALMTASGGEDGDVAVTQLVDKRPFSGYWEYHIDAALFTSPPIGNHSGAALFSRRGELLGIGSLLVGDARARGQPLPGNMFVPVDLLKPILDEMQRTGSTSMSRRPWIGLNSTERQGRVEVVRVSKGSPADDAGLRGGDVVLAVDGTRVATLEEFYKRLWNRSSPDAQVGLTVLQGGELKNVVLKPIDRMTTFARPAGI